MILIKWIFSVSHRRFPQVSNKEGCLEGLRHSGGLLQRVVKTLSLPRRVTSEGTLITQVTSEGPPKFTKEGQ